MGVRKVRAERSDWGSCAELKAQTGFEEKRPSHGGCGWAQWLTRSEEVRKTRASSASIPPTSRHSQSLL